MRAAAFSNDQSQRCWLVRSFCRGSAVPRRPQHVEEAAEQDRAQARGQRRGTRRVRRRVSRRRTRDRRPITEPARPATLTRIISARPRNPRLALTTDRSAPPSPIAVRGGAQSPHPQTSSRPRARRHGLHRRQQLPVQPRTLQGGAHRPQAVKANQPPLLETRHARAPRGPRRGRAV